MSDYLLADDLSGALEAGAAFRARGTRVTLFLDERERDASLGLRVVSSETRNASQFEAHAVLCRLLAAQRADGRRLLLKKIDSTLRGPVGAEIRALIETLAPPLIVVCPANPAAGRTVRDGRLLVHGVPVADTEFRTDPGWPITESQVEKLLAAAGVTVARSVTLAELRASRTVALPKGGGVVVSDAETDEDLRRLVSVVCATEPKALFVGAGGLACALAAKENSELAGNATPPAPSVRSMLFVSGSRSDRSRRQMEELRDKCEVPLHEIGASSAPVALAEAVAGSLAACNVAALTVERDSGPVMPAEPIRWLTSVVRELIPLGPGPEMLIATGGETARALCTVAGIKQLELICEFEPGVGLAEVAPSRFSNLRWIVVKPGGFGATDIWGTIRRLGKL